MVQCPPLLSNVVAAMIAAGETNGLVLGFVRQIGDELAEAILLGA
jgi:hypothetical protein